MTLIPRLSHGANVLLSKPSYDLLCKTRDEKQQESHSTLFVLAFDLLVSRDDAEREVTLP